MTQPEQKEWKVLREFGVDLWKRGFVVEDEDAEKKVVIKAADKDHPLSERSPYQYRHGRWVAEWEDKKVGLQDYLREEEARFRERAEAFAGLPHENVALVHEVCVDGRGCLTAVAEYVEGEPITTALAGAPLPVVIGHFRQMMEGLAFIHDLGRLYLHVNPQFILTDISSERTKITNWWETRKKGEPFERNESLIVHYIAPEIVFEKKACESSDLYAAAALFGKIWLGRPVYPRSYLPDVLIKHVKAERDVSPEALARDPADGSELKFCGLISKLLKKDPDERGFSGARDVIGHIVREWPEFAGPSKELYGGVMTTVRM